MKLSNDPVLYFSIQVLPFIGCPLRTPAPIESRTCRMLLEEKFLDICQTVLRLRNSKSAHVHFMLMETIPRLAMFRTEIFIQVRSLGKKWIRLSVKITKNSVVFIYICVVSAINY